MFSSVKTVSLLLLFLCYTLSAEQYTVQSGDTVYSIAKRHGLSVNDILNENPGINITELRVGHVINVPIDTSLTIKHESFTQYRVKKGDTLYSIARRFDTTPDALQKINKLQGSAIKAGMSLQISHNTAEAGSDVGSAVAAPLSSAEAQYGLLSSSPFHWPASGKIQKLAGKFPGVSITTQDGSDGLAVASGRVTYAGSHSIFGNIVFVQHENGYVYVYAGLSELTVSVGNSVKQGSKLGTVVKTLQSGKSQLYFSVWKNDRYVDPYYAPRG